MNFSNEMKHEETEHHLYDLKESTDEIFKYNVVPDNGDVIDCSEQNNDENFPSSTKSHISIRQSMNVLLKDNQSDDMILPEKTDLKDLNPYEPPSTQLSIDNKSEETLLPINSYEENYRPSLFDMESCRTSTSLVLPQSIQNHIKSSNSFQQLWSPRVYSPKLIDSKISESTLSILRSLILLVSKLSLTGFYFLYSHTKILQYDTVFFGFCYLIGALFGMHAYYFIDFLLILICIISILVTTYEKWLFHYINLNAYNQYANDMENNNRYWKQIKLAAYGLAIGTISTLSL